MWVKTAFFKALLQTGRPNIRGGGAGQESRLSLTLPLATHGQSKRRYQSLWRNGCTSSIGDSLVAPKRPSQRKAGEGETARSWEHQVRARVKAVKGRAWCPRSCWLLARDAFHRELMDLWLSREGTWRKSTGPLCQSLLVECKRAPMLASF